MLTEQEIREARTQNTTWWPLSMGVVSFIESPQGWQQEEYAWNHNVSMWTCGPENGMVYYRVSGPDATKLMSDTCINKFSPDRTGIVKEVLGCREDGKLVFDTMCLVVAPNVYDLSGSSAYLEGMCEANGPYDVTIEYIAPRTMIQVGGPKSFELLSEFTDYDLTSIRFGHFVEPVSFCGYDDVRLARFGMTNELGFEIQTDPARTKDITDKLREAGVRYGLVEIGARDHMVQHAEAGQMSFTYGDALPAIYDSIDANAADSQAFNLGVPKICGSYEPEAWSDFYVSPVDIGLAHRIDFSHDFIGREALEKEVADPTRKYVCLEWNKEDVIDVYASMFADGEPHERLDTPHYDYMELPRDARLPIEASKVLVDGEQVAFTTARTYMYSFRKMVSNCLMPMEYTEPGREVTIIWGEPGHPQKEIRATVQTHPYKPIANQSLPSDRKR